MSLFKSGSVAHLGNSPLLVETSRALPLVSLNVAIKTGAIADAWGKEGTCRILSRLMRRTAGGKDSQWVEERLDTLGSSLSGDVAQSATVFQGTVISRNLPQFVDLLVDALSRPGLNEDEFARLVRETHAELTDSLDDDRGLARRFFRRKLFEQHLYSRSATGTSASITNLSIDDVRSVYRDLWSSDKLLFAFAGDLTEEQARPIAERVKAALPEHTHSYADPEHPSIEAGRRLVIVDKPERSQTQILIGGLGTWAHDPDHLALVLANTVFGGTFTARLTQEVRSKRGWSYGAYSSLPFDRRRQSFSMWTFPKAEDAAACIQLQLDLLKTWIDKGVTKKELAWVKRYLVRSNAFNVDTATKRVGLALDSALYDLPEGYYEHYLERLQAVTLDEVNAAIQQRISAENLLIVVVGTESLIGDAIRAAVPNLAKVEVLPFDS